MAAAPWLVRRPYLAFFTAVLACGCTTVAAAETPPPVKPQLIEAHQALGEAQALTDLRARERLQHATHHLLQRNDELEAWVLPLIASYLPPGTPLVRQVHLSVHLPRPVLVRADGVSLDVASPWWNGRSKWAGVISGLYMAALNQVRPPRPGAAPETKDELSELLVDQLYRLGMASFVAGHGASAGRSGRDFTLFMPREEVETKVALLQEIMRSLRSGLPTPTAWRQLKAVQRDEAAIAVSGAYMAKVLEHRLGKAELLQVVQKGPRAFYDAYLATEPGALVYIPLPGRSVQKKPREAVAH